MPARDFSALRSFLADPRRPAETMRYHELQGFLFTIACAPELIRPLEWMPLVFGEKEAGYDGVEEAQAILGEMVALYNDVNAAARMEPATLPADCIFREETLANLEPDAPVSQWSRGFMHGHHWLEETWEPYIPDALDEELGAQLLALSFFSSKRLAERFLAETKMATLAALADTIRRAFPDAVAEYARLGRAIQKVLAEQPVRSAKVGRNDPCPCGSGRKYKKCCGNAGRV